MQPPPNIVLILLDDAGFADTSAFGGFAQTPELENLSRQGLRYNNFHTAGLCSPTRAALLSGRNQHRLGFGGIPVLAGNLPGYNCVWPPSAAAIPEILRSNGYATAAFGKWHNTPYRENSPIGPFLRWPTGLGFDYFYGFQEAAENQWEPSSLYRNTTPVEPPATPEEGYHVTTDIVDEAIRWLHTLETLAPTKPYFLYLATGAVHAPHQVPREWIDRYSGSFDEGWDVLRGQVFARQKRLNVIPAEAELTPRPQQIPPWDSLPSNQKRLFARQMEVYAAFVSHTDDQVGRLLKAVQTTSRAEDTLILYIAGDNGSAGEGGLTGISRCSTSVDEQLRHIHALGGPEVPFNMYATGWAWMGNTPFKWWKAVASHFGGVRAPLVAWWPRKIGTESGLRTQFTHVTDVAPTLYEAASIAFPEAVGHVLQQPLDGVSFVDTFGTPDAPSRHEIQYFETYGNRAIYCNGWVAAAPYWVTTWTDPPSNNPLFDHWELYYVREDFSEARDLASEQPQRLADLRRLFDREAQNNNVFPLTASFGSMIDSSPPVHSNARYRYYSDIPRLQFGAMPGFAGRSYRIIVAAIVPDRGANGVIVSYGGRGTGFVLYARNNRLVYEHNCGELLREVIATDTELPSGRVEITVDFTEQTKSASNNLWPVGERISGLAQLSLDGQVIGTGTVSGVSRLGIGESFGIGRAYGSPVSNAFRPPFDFTGTIELVTVELS
jgi:arylsulfatase A-like enzyme